MTKAVIPALALLLLYGAACSTSAQIAPAGQTPQPGAPGAAPTSADASPANAPATAQSPRNATPGTTAPKPGAPTATARRTQRGPASRPNSTAPIANSRVVIYGRPQADKPSGDHPLLNITAVGNPLGIRSGTPIQVKLLHSADSGHVRNGDTLAATLAAPIGGLSTGTPVQLTVVQASQAGSLTSAGELSIQVTRIGNYDVLSLIVTAVGKEGKKELPDAAPAIGTEATFGAEQDLSFPAA